VKAADPTHAEAAQAIETFLEGKAGEWDWDDFVSVRYADAVLEKARRECIAVPDKFPSNDPRRYCSAEGMEVLRGIARRLRETCH
jgi:hypothetical protein